MAKSIAGTLFVYNGESMDYCYKEAINSLKEFCDYVIVVDAGSVDGTIPELKKLEDEKTEIILNNDWELHEGKTKLSHFSNIANQRAQDLGFDYIFNLQADEIVHENCYDNIREAVELNADGYLITRINLWASPYLQLNVPNNRMPCSKYIVRLAKSHYRSYDDAESMAVLFSNMYAKDIRIYHMGFVRKREVHPKKIRYMQGEVFKVGIDEKLGNDEYFNPYLWFSKQDLVPIDEPLPKIIQNWAKERYYND